MLLLVVVRLLLLLLLLPLPRCFRAQVWGSMPSFARTPPVPSLSLSAQ